MKLQLLYLDGCPNWHVADDRLREALEEIGSRVEVDGVDPFVELGADVGLSCRLYRTPAGLAGAPTVAQLVEVLADR